MQLTLHVIDGPERDRTATILYGESLVVGRASECGLSLPGDSELSRMHFSVVSADDGFALKDLNSANQTVMDEQAIALTELEDGDEIQAGQSLIEVEIGAAIQEDGIDSIPLNQTARFKRPGGYAASKNPAGERPTTKVRVNAVILLVLDGPCKGEQHIIDRGHAAVFGRGEEATIQMIKDEALSRIHFAIDFKGDTVEFKDLGSANGTELNKREVLAASLKNGDVIQAGDSKFHVQFQNMPFWDETGEGDPEGTSTGFRNLSDTVRLRRSPKA